MKKILSWICIYLITFFSFPIHVYAELDRLALPQGGSVVSGQVDINYAAIDRLNVNQSTNQAIVNWQSFNVGRDASVHFNQPGSKASILNNVLSGQSIINGKIFSNGRLFLVNPTGILTGPHSAIKAEGAILSTLNLTNQNFLNNNYQFNANSNSSLVNQGLIQGQYVALISPQVNNKGNIITSAATTIVAGDDVLLGISDSNNLTVKVAPSKLKAMAKNEGTIKTQNGIVTIKADAAQSLVDEVVKLPNARADGLVSENGVIKLISNSGSIQANKIKINAGSNGATEISGTLNSDNKEGKGGTIEITAKDIDVNSATISADGKTGGGKVLVGGDWQGTGELLQATYLNIDSNSKITANALTSGSGGTIVAWSDIKNSNSFTRVSGTLEAKGIDGSGGQIETSGASINTDGIRVNAGSTSGPSGLWLIDPYDYTINSSAATNITNALNAGTNVTIQTSANSSSFGSGGSSSGNGDITITSNIGTTAGSATSSTLTLEAARHIVSNSGVTISDGGSHSLSLAFTAGGNITFNGAVDVAGSINLTTTTYTSYVAGDQTTQSFSYTGAEQTWSVPTGVTSIEIDGYGGAGGHGASDLNARGGKGGRLVATSTVTAGETLYLYVGGKGGNTTVNPGTNYKPAWNPYSRGNALAGFNGGGAPGNHAAGAGGGATDVRRGGNSLSDRIYVAGGGGGGGNQRRYTQPGGDGGQGGGLIGGAGSRGGAGGSNQNSLSSGMGPNGRGGYGGNGGTQSAGGAAVNYRGLEGTLGFGGKGGTSGRSGGGGGGGYYGGSGGGDWNGSDAGGGGGGGSSYSSGTIITNTQGYSSATGNGSLTLTYTPLTASTTKGAITINQGIASGGNTTVSTQGALTVKESSSAKFGTITAASVSVNNTNTDITIANAPTVSGASTFDNAGALWLKNGGTFTGGLTVSNDGNFYANGTIQSTDSPITLKYFRNCASGIACGGLTVNSGGGAITMAGGYTWHNRSLTVRSQGGSTNTITDTGSYNSGQFGKIKMYADGDISLSGTLDVSNRGADLYIETDGILNMNNTAVLENDYYNETIEIRANGLINPGRIEVGRRYHSAPGTFTLRPISNSSSIEFSPTNDDSISTDVWYDSDLVVQTDRYGGGPWTGAAFNLGHGSQTGDIQMAAYDQKVRLTANTSGTVTLNGDLGGSNLISVNIPRGSVEMTGVTVATIAADSFAPSQTYSTVTVSGNSAITTSGGSPTVSMGGLIGSANLSSNTDMTIGSANTNGIFSGVLSGAMKLTVTGTGVFEPTATNTYTGGTVIDGGKIAAKTDRNFGANPSSDDPDNILLKNGGTIYFGSVNSNNSLGHVNFGYNNNRGIYLETGQHNFIDGSGGSGRNKIYSVISGVGGVTYGKIGNKTMTIYSANTYTGDTKFNYTTGSNNGVHIANADAWKYSTVYLNSTRTDVRKGWTVVSGGSINFGGLAGDATNWRWQNKQVTFGYNNQDTTFSGTISQYNNDGYDLVKVGTGTTTFSNTSSNAHQDDVNGINVQAGKVILSGNWGRNNDSNGNFNIESGATLEIDSSINNSFDGVLSGSGNLIINGSGIQTFTGTNTFSGSTTISSGKLKIGGSGVIGNATYSGTIANSGTFEYASSAAQTLSGVISGGGGLTKSGSGDLTLSGNSNTTGTISLSSGNLIAGSDNALGSAPTISASNTPTLKTSDGVTLPSLEVTGDIILETSVATTGAQIYNNDVQIKGTGYSLTSSGSNITISGDVAAWSNTGILQLRYNGSYIFNGGSAATANASSSTVGNGSLTYASGSYTWTKPSSTSSADLLIIAGGGGGGGSNVGGGGGAGGVIQKTAYSLGSSTYSVSIGAGGAGGLAHYDGGNGGNTEFGSLTAIGGGGGGGHSNRPHGKSGGSGGGASFWNGNPGSGTAGQGYSGAQETTGRNRGGGGGGAGGAGGQLNGEGTNGGIGIQSSITGTAQWYAGGGGAGTDGDTGNTYGGLIGGSGVGGDGGAARTAGNAAIAHTGSGGGGGGGHSSNRGGAGASGLVVISYSQASSSDLTINAAGAVTLSGAVSNFDFVNITNGETSSVAGVINGSGPLTKSGAGMLSLAGTNTYTGNTIVNAGTLRLSGSGSLGSGTYAGNITNNGIFRSVSSATQTLSGVISGTGRVDASGNSGALTLTGTNTYSGGARIASGGILVAGSGRALGSGASEIRSTSTSDQFSVSSGVTLDSLKVTGAVRLNSGITTTGAQTYTSDVLVASGTRASPVEFNTTNSDIEFGGTLKGKGNAKARSLTIDAGTGDVTFGDRVGYAFNGENFNANNTADSFYKMTVTAGTTTIKGDVMTYEEQTYNSNIDVGSTGSNGTTRTLLSMDPKVIINGNVNDTITNTHTLVAKAIAVRRDGITPDTPDVTYNGTIGRSKKLAGYSGVTGYQVVSKNYGVIDTDTSFGSVTGGTQTNGTVASSSSSSKRSSQSNGRKTEKSANAVAKSAQTTIADAGKNLIATLFGGGPSGGGRSFSKSIEVVMPGDAGFNQPGPETGSGADFGKPGNNQSAPSFEPRGNNSIGGAPAPKSQGGNFDSTNQGTSSPKPRSIKELFSSKDFKNQFSSKQEMRQFKRQLRQEFKNNPGSRKSFNKALRDGFDPTDPKSFEKARPEEKKAFRKFKEGDDDPRKLLDKSKDRPDERGKGQDNNNNLNISEDDEEEKRSGDKAKTN